MICLAGLFLVLLLFVLGRDIVQLSSGEPLLPGNQTASRLDQATIVIFRGFFYVVFFIVMPLIIYGSVCAIKLRKRGFAQAAMILACIPLFGSPFVVLGIPFGIWGLSAINQATSARLFR